MLCQFLIWSFGADWQAERYNDNNLVKRVQEKIKIWRKFIFPFLTNFGPKMKNFLIVTFCPFTLWPNFFPLTKSWFFPFAKLFSSWKTPTYVDHCWSDMSIEKFIIACIVIMKVSYSLLLSPLLSVNSWSVKEKSNARGLPVTITWPPKNCNVNHQLKFTTVLHSLAMWKVSTNLLCMF